MLYYIFNTHILILDFLPTQFYYVGGQTLPNHYTATTTAVSSNAMVLSDPLMHVRPSSLNAPTKKAGALVPIHSDPAPTICLTSDTQMAVLTTVNATAPSDPCVKAATSSVGAPYDQPPQVRPSSRRAKASCTDLGNTNPPKAAVITDTRKPPPVTTPRIKPASSSVGTTKCAATAILTNETAICDPPPQIRPSSCRAKSTSTNLGNTNHPIKVVAVSDTRKPPAVTAILPAVACLKSPTKRHADTLPDLKQKQKKLHQSPQPSTATTSVATSVNQSPVTGNQYHLRNRLTNQHGKKGKTPAKVSVPTKIHSPSQERHIESKYTKSRGLPAETDNESNDVHQNIDVDEGPDETIDFYYNSEDDSI